MMKRFLILACLLSLSLLGACGDDGSNNAAGGDTGSTADAGGDAETDAASGPQVVDIVVNPSEIPQSDTGMTDETLDISIECSDLAEWEIVSVAPFLEIGGDNREAAIDDFVAEGNIIEVVGVGKSWLNGLPTGEYTIGVTLTARDSSGIEGTYTYNTLGSVEITP